MGDWIGGELDLPSWGAPFLPPNLPKQLHKKRFHASSEWGALAPHQSNPPFSAI